MCGQEDLGIASGLRPRPHTTGVLLPISPSSSYSQFSSYSSHFPHQLTLSKLWFWTFDHKLCSSSKDIVAIYMDTMHFGHTGYFWALMSCDKIVTVTLELWSIRFNLQLQNILQCFVEPMHLCVSTEHIIALQISLLCSYSFVMEHNKWKSKYR